MNKEGEDKKEKCKKEEHNKSQEEKDVVREVEPLLVITPYIIYLMSRIIQWNCKGLMPRHEEIRFLMKRF